MKSQMMIVIVIAVLIPTAGVSVVSCALNPEGNLAGQETVTSGSGGAGSSSTSSGSPGAGGNGSGGAGGAPACIQQVFPGKSSGEDCNDVLFPRVLSEGLMDEWGNPLDENNALILGRFQIPNGCSATGFSYRQVSVVNLCGKTAHNAVWFTGGTEQPDLQPALKLIPVEANQPPWNQNERVLSFTFPQPITDQYLFVGAQLAVPNDKNRTCVSGCGDAVGILDCLFLDTQFPIAECPQTQCTFEPLSQSPTTAPAIVRRATFEVSITLDCCPL